MSGASCRFCFVKEEATLITVDGRWRMKVKIEVSKMISFKRRRCADRFLTPTQCPVPARASRRVVPIAAFIDHNFSIPHDLLQLGSPHNLLGATRQPVCVEPRQRELRVLGHIFGPNARQSNLHREIEAITIQTGADQPLQPTIVALTSRGEKMRAGWLGMGVASGFRVSIYRLPVVRQVRR